VKRIKYRRITYQIFSWKLLSKFPRVTKNNRINNVMVQLFIITKNYFAAFTLRVKINFLSSTMVDYTKINMLEAKTNDL